MLLIVYRQADTVGAAIAGALAQTYSPLQILISDDASGDDTWAAIQTALTGYRGPHHIVLNRNPVNMGIGAHLSHLVSASAGELLFVAAGDDVSLPQRCARTVQAWLAHGRRPDLIASALIDMDAEGTAHGILRPADLADWRSAADWVRDLPLVVGAGQAWTRRVFDRFGPLPAGVVAEDLIMVFRAIVSGGAVTLDDALVMYRRGGISRRRRALTARQVRQRLASNACHALVELPCLLRDAARAEVRDQVAPALEAQLARERHVAAQLGAPTDLGKRPVFGCLRRLLADRHVPLALRLRVFVYAACPAVLAPGFALKRGWLRWRGQLHAPP
jgi:glycosyltransferase involved in cell wall biosynthesis